MRSLVFLALVTCTHPILNDSVVRVHVVCADGQVQRGSGFVADARHVVTAKHVVKCSEGRVAHRSVHVELPDGTRLLAPPYSEAIVDAIGLEVTTGLPPLAITLETPPENIALTAVTGAQHALDGLAFDVIPPYLVATFAARAGDSGSPVFNAAGAVIGIVKSRLTYGTLVLLAPLWVGLTDQRPPSPTAP